MFEKIIFNHLYNHLTTYHLIPKNQSGFRPGDSTTNQLIDLVNEIHQAFDSTKSHEVRAIFLDISKAFDKVWHDGLIFKMRQNVYGRLLQRLQDYLSKRKQRVALNGFPADQSGICQGNSTTNQLLFLVDEIHQAFEDRNSLEVRAVFLDISKAFDKV